MSTSTSPSMLPTLAFLGATGGCAGFALASALNAGYHCRALARTSSKLTESLIAKGIDAATLDTHLVIIQGDAKDIPTIKKTITTPSGGFVDRILSGIGGYPTLQASLTTPMVATDPTLCEDAAATVVQAAQQLAADRRITDQAQLPLLISFTTTGVEPAGLPGDVPALYVPLYRWLLHSVHADKRRMEELLRAHVAQTTQRGLRGVVLVKSTLLIDGDGKGVSKVRVGHDEQPAKGYSIQRKDVGVWTFENLVQKEPRAEWRNKSATLTY